MKTRINENLKLIFDKGDGMIGFKFLDKNLVVKTHSRKDFKFALKCAMTDKAVKKIGNRTPCFEDLPYPRT